MVKIAEFGLFMIAGAISTALSVNLFLTKPWEGIMFLAFAFFCFMCCDWISNQE